MMKGGGKGGRFGYGDGMHLPPPNQMPGMPGIGPGMMSPPGMPMPPPGMPMPPMGMPPAMPPGAAAPWGQQRGPPGEPPMVPPGAGAGGGGTTSSAPPPNAKSGFTNSSVAGDEQSLWSEHQTSHGFKYYFHSEKNLSQYETPEELKTEFEKAVCAETRWREFKIWDGRTFWFNEETQISVWAMPEEVQKIKCNFYPNTPFPEVDPREIPMLTRREMQANYKKLLLNEKSLNAKSTFANAEEVVTDPCGLQEEERRHVFAECLAYLKNVERAKQVERWAHGEKTFRVELLELLKKMKDGEDEVVCYDGLNPKMIASWDFVRSEEARREVVENAIEEHLKARHSKELNQNLALLPVLHKLFCCIPQISPELSWPEAEMYLEKEGDQYLKKPGNESNTTSSNKSLTMSKASAPNPHPVVCTVELPEVMFLLSRSS